MIVYFVNRNSNLKGPYSIITGKGDKLQIGDICILEKESSISILIVTDSANLWSKCKKVYEQQYTPSMSLNNSLLCSFDGIKLREGNTNYLKILKTIFISEVVISFLNNLQEILEYKLDAINVNNIMNLINSKLTSTEHPTSINDPSNGNKSFLSFFSSENQELVSKLRNEGKPFPEIFAYIRKSQPEKFRAAMVKFLFKNPNKSIYDGL